MKRRGTSAVECALVYPAVFMFVIGLMVGGMGMFRYQEVVWLARCGSRYASVHGSSYATATGNSAATQTSVASYVSAQATSLDSNSLTCTMSPSTAGAAGSTVTVTVSYQWFPEVYIVGPITLTSTSTLTMSY